MYEDPGGNTIHHLCLFCCIVFGEKNIFVYIYCEYFMNAKPIYDFFFKSKYELLNDMKIVLVEFSLQSIKERKSCSAC